jgi:hypothetical protein
MLSVVLFLQLDQLCRFALTWLFIQDEWRGIGVQQSRGWVHYAIHRPEPHIMLFRRPLDSQQSHQQKAQQNA